MSWDRSAITDIGVAMLNESLAGRTLTITSAAGGAGTTENLKTAADLADRRQTFALIGIEEIPPDPAQGIKGGKQIGIQITSAGVEERYILHQVGVYAKLDYEERESLLFLIEDERGVEIPPAAERPDFLFELFAVLAVSNDAQIVVGDGGPALFVTLGLLEEALAAHNSDPAAHVGTGGGSATAALTLPLTVPVESWSSEGGTADYPCTAALAHEAVRAHHLPLLALDPASLPVAAAARLAPAVLAEERVLRLWAKRIPAAPLRGTLALLGGGSEVAALPVATPTTLGAVKVGGGLSVEQDGTLSVNAVSLTETVIAEATAPEAEVEEMLDEVYGDNSP